MSARSPPALPMSPDSRREVPKSSRADLSSPHAHRDMHYSLAARHTHADFVQVAEQIGGIFVHPVGAGPFKLIEAVPTRQQPHPERAGAAGGGQIPHPIADPQPRRNPPPHALRPKPEEIPIRLPAPHVPPRL